MPEKKIYCGAGKVPKDAKRGGPDQCMNKGQIRYYGIEKIDIKLLEANEKYKKKLTSIKTKMKNIENKIKKIKQEMKKKDNNLDFNKEWIKIKKLNNQKIITTLSISGMNQFI